MSVQRTEPRNRDIFAAYQKGKSIETLAERYGLSGTTVHQIIITERHKIAVSVDAFYKRMRSRDLPRP